MNNKQYKFAIGCLIQWYEADIIENYFISLRDALREHYSTFCIEGIKQKVYIDLCISTNTQLEKPENDDTLRYCVDKIVSKFKVLDNHPDIRLRYVSETLYTISDYRRDFNDYYCDKADLLIWGESDMLVPREMFIALDSLLRTNQVDAKFIATFATCKMWDRSWQALEHPHFMDKNHSDSEQDWWGVNYTMSITEMNTINGAASFVDVGLVRPLKFNGCGLVISSEIIKAGINVPRAAFFVHEDTAFLNLLNTVFPDLKQYHFSNILMVHNRKHLSKRNYIKGESGQTIGQKRKSNEWYVKANQCSEHNCYNLFNCQESFYSWDNIFIDG